MEENGFEWLMDIEPAKGVTEVTSDNVRTHMRVRISPDSNFFHQTKPNEIGVVERFSDFNGGYNCWVVVKFESIEANIYQIGPDNFDLLMVD